MEITANSHGFKIFKVLLLRPNMWHQTPPKLLQFSAQILVGICQALEIRRPDLLNFSSQGRSSWRWEAPRRLGRVWVASNINWLRRRRRRRRLVGGKIDGRSDCCCLPRGFKSVSFWGLKAPFIFRLVSLATGGKVCKIGIGRRDQYKFKEIVNLIFNK